MNNIYTLKELPKLVDIYNLGYVGFSFKPLDLSVLPKEFEYKSPNPKRFWVSGVQTGDVHVTLKYGLTHKASEIRAAVDEVLEGWQPEPGILDGLNTFYSPFPDEEYACIVGTFAHPASYSAPGWLQEANFRLSMLPHIDTFPDYKPHVTLAYVQKDKEQEALDALQTILPVRLEPIGLDYGRE